MTTPYTELNEAAERYMAVDRQIDEAVERNGTHVYDEAIAEPQFSESLAAFIAYNRALGGDKYAVLMTILVYGSDATPKCSCCRQPTFDLKRIPDGISEAVEEHESWANEGESDTGAFCEDCIDKWEDLYGEKPRGHWSYGN